MFFQRNITLGGCFSFEHGRPVGVEHDKLKLMGVGVRREDRMKYTERAIYILCDHRSGRLQTSLKSVRGPSNFVEHTGHPFEPRVRTAG